MLEAILEYLGFGNSAIILLFVVYFCTHKNLLKCLFKELGEDKIKTDEVVKKLKDDVEKIIGKK